MELFRRVSLFKELANEIAVKNAYVLSRLKMQIHDEKYMYFLKITNMNSETLQILNIK